MNITDTPTVSHRLREAGLTLRRHPQRIAALQWSMVLAYALLVVTPVLLPPGGRLVWLAQLASWGLWWPLVILSVMLLGRSWCGLLCPEGMLAEWVSWRGMGRPIPAWIRWGGWPLLAFFAITLYGQLTEVYTQPRAALLLLGGTTATAVLVGLLYGRGKRVWCRYLCPVTGVFGLLARIAPVHFRVEREAWERAPQGLRASGSNQVNCAPLLDIRRLQSASDCNMCGRCAGERNAVQLALRSPHAETLRGDTIGAWPACLLLFGLLGMAPATFLWPHSPWSMLLSRDGTLLAGWLAIASLLLGGWQWLWLRLAARHSGQPWTRLASTLIPFAGLQLFAGLSLITSGQFASIGLSLPGLEGLRSGALVAGALWSLCLARLLAGKLAPVFCLVAGLALPLAAWSLVPAS